MNDDPLTPVKQKLDEIHDDVKGGFKTVHDRMDREVNERAWSLVGIRQAIYDLEQRIINWFRSP